MIAACSEMIEALEAYDRTEDPFGSQVRRMGKINSALNDLATFSVYVTIGSFRYRKFEYGSDFMGEAPGMYADEYSAVMIRFSSDEAKHITRKVYVGPTDEELDKAIDMKKRMGFKVYDNRNNDLSDDLPF